MVVDDFGVKFKGDYRVNHLKKVLEQYYEVSIDWSGGLFCGITLDWNYEKGYADTSMSGYIPKALNKYQHPKPKRPQDVPSKFKPINYGATVQNPDVDTPPPISNERIRHIQDVVGTVTILLEPNLMTHTQSN